MQKMENNRFMDAVCCSVMDLNKETAIATSAWADMRDMYAARTAGTWEWAPASHVAVIHSIYMLVTSGTPIPPWVRLVCMATSETLPFPSEDPCRPRLRCIHWEMSPRTRPSSGQSGMPPWIGNNRRRMRVPSSYLLLLAARMCTHYSAAQK